MPISIARKIHKARNRSRMPSDLKAETLASLGTSWSCFSGSVAIAGSAEREAVGVGVSVVVEEVSLCFSRMVSCMVGDGGGEG